MRQNMECCRFRAAIENLDLYAYIFRRCFGILYKNIEIFILIKGPCIEKFVLQPTSAAPAVLFNKVPIWILGLWIFVEVFHVRMGRRTIEIEVVLFYILTMIAL